MDEKPAVRGKKSGGLDEKPAVRDGKSGGLNVADKLRWSVIESRCAKYGFKNVATLKINAFYDSVDFDGTFSAVVVRKFFGCADSSAREFLSKLKEIEVVAPVKGEGKGVYRFKTDDE